MEHITDDDYNDADDVPEVVEGIIKPAQSILMRSDGTIEHESREDECPLTDEQLRQKWGIPTIEDDIHEAPPGKRWLIPHIAEATRPIWFAGTYKVGKTLFILQKTIEASLGLPTSDIPIADCDQLLWTPADGERTRILYLDNENLYFEDVLPNIRDMDYDLTGLSDNFLYMSYPRCEPLNTSRGAAYVISIVDEFAPDVVVVDSVSSFTTGNEKEAETWTRLNQELLIPLRIRDVAVILLDHVGYENADRNIGSSAKGRIADALWVMKPVKKGDQEHFTLNLAYARAKGMRHQKFDLHRTAEQSPDPLRHTLSVRDGTKVTQRTTQGAAARTPETKVDQALALLEQGHLTKPVTDAVVADYFVAAKFPLRKSTRLEVVKKFNAQR